MSKLEQLVKDHLASPREQQMIVPEDILNLRNLCVQLIDIEYRRKHKKSLDWKDGKGYNDHTY